MIVITCVHICRSFKTLFTMRDNGTPPHTSSDGLGDGYDEDAMIYDDDDDFDEDDMIEIVDDDNDGGNLADDEEDEQMNYGAGPGMEGFTGQQPDHILTSHLGYLRIFFTFYLFPF